MPQNQFLPFATGAGADTLAYAAYATQGYLSQGFQAGVAQPYDINTVLRQLSTVVSALAQFTANNQSADVLDDGVVSNFVTKFTAALQGALASEMVHYGAATGTNDALVVTASPPLVATPTQTYQPGSFLIFKTINGTPNQTTAPTINANSIGNIAITKRGGAPLSVGDLPSNTWMVAFFDGVGCYLINPTLSDLGVPPGALWHVGVDNSQSASTILATVTPAVATRVADLAYLIIPANACAGATQINVGFGLQPLTRNDATPLQANDYLAGQPLVVVDDGTQFRVLSMTPNQVGSNTTTIINNLRIVGSTPHRYAAAGSYTLAIPANTSFSITECRGGGGGGGGASGSGYFGSGGAGAGNAFKVATATSATVLLIVVGAGGTAGTAGGGNGGSGGTTSIAVQSGTVVDVNGTTFTAGQTLCAAAGGTGGTGAPGSNPTTAGVGGIAAGGDLNDTGDNGGLGILYYPPSGAALGGSGGLSPGSGGEPLLSIGAGNASSAPGTGGDGGSSGSVPGAPGTVGRVTIFK